MKHLNFSHLYATLCTSFQNAIRICKPLVVYRVLGHAESCVFLRQLLVLYAYFSCLILIYANFIFCWRVSKKHLKTTAGAQIWLPPQKIRRSPLILSPRVCHKMSSRPFAVGVISFSSRPIRTSHSNRVFIDRTIFTPLQIWEARGRLVLTFPSACKKTNDSRAFVTVCLNQILKCFLLFWTHGIASTAWVP